MNRKFKLKPLASPLSSKAITTKRSLVGSLLLVSSAALVGCQSTTASLTSNESLAANSSASQSAAKSALSAALQKQRRSSFSYHSNIEISNEQQFTAIDKSQLVAAESVESYCEDTHDNAYAEIIAQAQAQNLDVSAGQLAAERDSLKNAYLQCAAAYQAWDANRYEEEQRYLYDEYGYEDSGSISPPQNVSPYYQQLFDDYENKSTALDIKKAQLLDTYLLKPLSINAQGVYQPLAGRFTMLMSAQYQARNNHTSVNQPIYVDFKTGNIYLWADNFALLTSEFADDKLGTQWQNKWLRLAIDDGSLPKGFGSAVIKAHFEALDRTYEAAPLPQFDYITPTRLAALSPKLPASQLNAMTTLPTKQIVRRIQSAESYEQFYKDYVSIFYELITNQYPELIKNNPPDESGDPRPDAMNLTSKVLVQQALAVMKEITDRQADNLVSEVMSASSRPDSEEEVVANPPPPTIQILYGLNQRGQIQWQHQRNQYADSQKAAKGMTIDVLQQYSPVTSAVAFPNLPADKQIPNASNSVDIREYGRELKDYYEQGNGTAIGKMLYSSLPMAKVMYSSIIGTAMEQAEYEEGVEETAE